MAVEIIPAYGFPEEVGTLFLEYTDMVVENAPGFAEYLKLQNFDEERKHLETKYGAPDGRLYLALCDGKVAGCIGLKRIDEENCEMKRLYVRPEFRGKAIGRKLAETVVADAKTIGYRHMLLDTFHFLETAVKMYRQMGFYEIASYNNSPMDGLIYLRLDL